MALARRRSFVLVALMALAAAAASAGVGVWTTNSTAATLNVVVDAGTGAVYADDHPYTISKSLDNGMTWQEVNVLFAVGGTALSAQPLAAGPFGTVYVAFYSGGQANTSVTLYASRNGSSEWVPLAQATSTIYSSLIVDPFVTTTLYRLDTVWGSSTTAVMRSADSGATWSDMSQGLNLTYERHVTTLAADSRTPNVLYLAIESTNPSLPPAATIYKTTDGGSSWTLLTATLPGAVAALTVDPSSPSTLYAGVASGTTGTFRSDDGGNTFRPVNAFAASQIVLDPNHANRIYVATAGQGVQTSADGGGTWAPMNTGLTDLTVHALAIDATRGFLHAATGSGVFDLQLPNPGDLTLSAAHPFTITLFATDQRTGRTGSGVATRMNDLWGYFSIPAITSNTSNPEVFVKMLDATAINGEYWFFYGGLTDLEYTLTVTENATGLAKTYTKPAGSECGGSDTAAFTP